MKFLNAVFPAALAGLLLLVPAVYAVPHFKCGGVLTVSIRQIESSMNESGYQRTRPDDPEGQDGQQYLSCRFNAVAGDDSFCMAQRIDEHPNYRVYLLRGDNWQPCVYMSN
ncbi:BgTH12-07808 [Blumeria graminis f. sp. triticale]|uniref:BgTH12-07808 n=1 Tax=Blumeria graminis f. sp. triticale TaxID=1689686 RepID=A0A9W4DDU0_BLUGR|nr:BgTH12-07808 [Blumeria graminis f. sp. triticale]